MERASLSQYEEYPKEMLVYMRHYGPHFNRKMFEFAVSQMTYEDEDGKEKSVTPYTKDEISNLLSMHGVEVRRNQLYDAAYVATMCKADFLGSSIKDEKHLALYVKDVIDDIDAPDGLVFNRWYADMCYKGIAIDWEAML
jgi:hypothetical protein